MKAKSKGNKNVEAGVCACRFDKKSDGASCRQYRKTPGAKGDAVGKPRQKLSGHYW